MKYASFLEKRSIFNFLTNYAQNEQLRVIIWNFQYRIWNQHLRIMKYASFHEKRSIFNFLTNYAQSEWFRLKIYIKSYIIIIYYVYVVWCFRSLSWMLSRMISWTIVERHDRDDYSVYTIWTTIQPTIVCYFLSRNCIVAYRVHAGYTLKTATRC